MSNQNFYTIISYNLSPESCSQTSFSSYSSISYFMYKNWDVQQKFYFFFLVLKYLRG